MLEMNLEIRQLWTGRLRSGSHTQGFGYLDYVDPEDGQQKQCCLGVLCQLAAEAGVVMRYATSRGPQRPTVYSYAEYGEVSVLPKAVQIWAGLSDSDPILIEMDDPEGNDDSICCTSANDDYRRSFVQIADLIDGGVDNAGDES